MCDAVFFICNLHITIGPTYVKYKAKKFKKKFRILVLFQQRYFKNKKMSQGELQNTLQSQIHPIIYEREKINNYLVNKLLEKISIYTIPLCASGFFYVTYTLTLQPTSNTKPDPKKIYSKIPIPSTKVLRYKKKK